MRWPGVDPAFVLPLEEETTTLAVQNALALPFGMVCAFTEFPADVRPRTLRHPVPWQRPVRFPAVGRPAPYQFRHGELQKLLATHPEPPAPPNGVTSR